MFRRTSSIALAICLCTLATILLPARPAVAASAATQPAAKSVIAVFNISTALTEQPVDDPFAALSGAAPMSLRDLVMRMKKAAGDPAVKAVAILCDDGSFGIGQTEELRQAIAGVRSAGKDVYAHSDSMMMGHYLLLCGASRVSVSPTGDVWLTGLYGDTPYLHGLLTKIGVEPDFLHCGAYKSASEIFMRESPSPEADAMENWLLDSIYDNSVNLIASGRKLSAAQVRKLIDDGPYTAEKAKAAGLIDAVETRADFEAAIHDKFGKDAGFEKHYGSARPPQLDFSNPFALMRTLADLMAGPKSAGDQKPAIGVVYVDGMIVLGKNSGPFASSLAASTDIARALDDAASDDSVKAVVLRIDSPGGSATASEIILAAAQRVKAKKPLVVSMGDVAGSGGYYVTCAADTIFADESTITASIGVVGGKFATTAMWNKLGITFKAYQRGANAGLLSSDSVFSPSERQRMQAWMDDIYGVFKGHVVASRGSKLKKPIDDLAAGRVFTGHQALELGLVDKIGTLSDAIEFAAAGVKLSDYDVRTVPQPKNFLEKLMEQTSGDDDSSHVSAAIGASSGGQSSALLKLAAPFLAGLDAQHVRLVTAALDQLQLVQNEGVVLTMPAWNFGTAASK